MTKRLHLLILFFTLSFSACPAQGIVAGEAIDETLEECLALAGDDGEIAIGCQYAAREAWDREVTRYYKILMDTLQPAQQKQLKAAQAKWVMYRDSEMLFSGSLYRGLKGGMWMVINAERTTDIHRKRARELMEYYDMLTFDPE